MRVGFLRPDISLIPLQEEHAPSTFVWMTDPAVSGGIGLRTTPTLEKTQDWVRRAKEDPTIQAFAILLGDRHVGNVVLDKIDTYLQTARLSIYLGEKIARGAGVGRTAVFLAAKHGFSHLGLYKIWLTVHAENQAALAAYYRVGFIQEGILRGEFMLEGRRLPACYLGLLRDEFLCMQKGIDPEAAS